MLFILLVIVVVALAVLGGVALVKEMQPLMRVPNRPLQQAQFNALADRKSRGWE